MISNCVSPEYVPIKFKAALKDTFRNNKVDNYEIVYNNTPQNSSITIVFPSESMS